MFFLRLFITFFLLFCIDRARIFYPLLACWLAVFVEAAKGVYPLQPESGGLGRIFKITNFDTISTQICALLDRDLDLYGQDVLTRVSAVAGPRELGMPKRLGD